MTVPLAHDPNSPAGREALGLETTEGIAIDPFRVLPGDETSCLNLYQPTNPRILGATRRFIERCLAPDPAARYADMTTVERALEELLAS